MATTCDMQPTKEHRSHITPLTIRAVSGAVLLSDYEISADGCVRQVREAVEKVIGMSEENRCRLVVQDRILMDDATIKGSGLSGNADILAVIDVAPLPIALLFPSSGSAHADMFNATMHIPAVRDMLEKAKVLLGYDMLSLCLRQPEHFLRHPRHCHSAIYVAGLAGMELLRGEREDATERMQAVAGLQVGEYAALCAAEVLSFEDGLCLADLFGKVMEELSSTEGPQLWVAGLGQLEVEKLCAEAARRERPNGVCQISKVLFPRGYVCAGSRGSIATMGRLAEQAGAHQTSELQSSGMIHTPFFDVASTPAMAELQQALQDMQPRMRPPKCNVYMNSTGGAVTPGTPSNIIVSMLMQQLMSPVRWESLVTAMHADGISEFYVFMKQLRAIMKRIDVNIWSNTRVVKLS